jgi:hypothetical protein
VPWWITVQCDFPWRSKKWDALSEGMAAVFLNPVETSKPGSETQRPRGFSQRHSTVPTHEHTD